MQRPSYKSVIARKNVIKEIMFTFFLSICSIPRLLLEVFIRRDLGERYFSLSTAIAIAVFMAVIPIGDAIDIDFLSNLGFSRHFDILDFLYYDLSWYVFLAAFIAKSLDRNREIKQSSSAFEVERFSKTSGYTDPVFLNFVLQGKKLSTRTIETIVEPAAWFAVGLVLAMMQQHIGIVILCSSICYSLSYFAAYHEGDNWLLDILDDRIMAEEATRTFVDDLPADKTRGVQIRARRPTDPELRRQLAQEIVGNKEAFEVM